MASTLSCVPDASALFWPQSLDGRTITVIGPVNHEVTLISANAAADIALQLRILHASGKHPFKAVFATLRPQQIYELNRGTAQRRANAATRFASTRPWPERPRRRCEREAGNLTRIWPTQQSRSEYDEET
jgi:hypothetical protein